MKFFSKQNERRVAARIEKKENPIGGAVLFENKYRVKEKNLKEYFKEGYVENVIVYRAIREIVTALGSVDIEVHNKEGEPIPDHPALKLLKKPNPTEGWSQFLRHAFIEYLITGNMFLTKYPDTKQPSELWVMASKNTEVHAGAVGLPLKYVYNSGSTKKEFPVDQVTGKSQVFQLKTYNPDSAFLGLPPMAHVALSADTHNSGLRWNNSLLENGARPSGIVYFKGTPDKATLGVVREWFKETLQGKRNAGEVPILTEEAKWESMSDTARDMDFLNTMREMAKYVASAYGVPLPLIDNDSSTFNNLEQAKERLWTDTVLPLLNEFLETFGNWLLPAYGEGLSFAYDMDSIPALEGLRQKRFDRMAKAVASGMMTVNEARTSIGYEEVEGGDTLMIPSGLLPLGEEDTTEADDDNADMTEPEEDPDDDDTEDESAMKFLKSIGYDAEEIKQIMAEDYDGAM